MFWENEWVIGISVGIISGLIIYFIQIFVASFLTKREYYKNVESANEEILSLLKSVISEGEYPSILIQNSLIKSIARKYRVKIDDLNTIPDVLDDLIREVFDTSFMSIDKKIESANKLLELKNQYSSQNTDNAINVTLRNTYYKNTTIASTLTTSTLLAVSSAFIVSINNSNKFFYEDLVDKLSFSLIPIGITSLSLVLGILSFINYKKNKELDQYIQKTLEKFKKFKRND